MGVELHNPVANDLKRHAANLCSFRARGAFVDRRQSQQPPSLGPVLRSFGCGPRHLGVKIGPKRYWHGEPPSIAALNHLKADLKTPAESASPRSGITSCLRDVGLVNPPIGEALAFNAAQSGVGALGVVRAERDAVVVAERELVKVAVKVLL